MLKQFEAGNLAVLLGVTALGLGATMPAGALVISWSSNAYSNTATNLLFGYFGAPTANEAIQFDYNTTGLYYLSDIDIKLPGTAKFDTTMAPVLYQSFSASGTGGFVQNNFTASDLNVSFGEGAVEEGLANDFGVNLKITKAGGTEMLGPNPFDPGFDQGTGNGVNTTILNGAKATLTFMPRAGVSGPSPVVSFNLYAPPGGTPPGTSSTGNSL